MKKLFICQLLCAVTNVFAVASTNKSGCGTVEGGFLRISALLFMEAVAGLGQVVRTSIKR